MLTEVVNLRTHKFDVKITRNYKGEVPEPPEFGCFGNPYKLEEHGREECIRLFEVYFEKRIKEDTEFRSAVLALQGKRLACFCKPLACHGDVIKRWLDAQPIIPLVKQVDQIVQWVRYYFGLNEMEDEFTRRMRGLLETGKDPHAPDEV